VPIVLVPGFTQTAASWRGVLDALRDPMDTITFDKVPVRATFEATALAIGDHAGPGVYVGYSMGGRLCLRLALDRPDLVQALVLVSASPGLGAAAERTDRIAGDDALARRLEADGVDAFLQTWVAQPMFATIPADAPGIDDRRRLSTSYLAACLRVLGTGAMEPLWDRLPELGMPALLVTGTRDEKFDGIATAMLDGLPDTARHVRLDGGHALPLEQPAGLGAVVAEFARVHGSAHG
jgi:2-succinyl-6-hydroxy-2,4-cyclohexadiene-1-carboxylate synthase